MFRTIGLMLATIGVLALALGCSDDDTKKDKGGITLDKGGLTLDQGAGPEASVGPEASTPDQKVTTPDTGTPTKAKNNSGAICTASKACPNASDEVCVSFTSGATKGMCLGKCTPDTKNPKNPINICPVKDSTTMMSVCALGYKDSTSGKQGYMCGFYCSVTQSGTTKTYKCPNATDYDCKAIDSKNPGVKVCVPK